MEQLKRTPLHTVYGSLAGVKLADFHGWELPIHFASGIQAEHRSVRTSAGLFDVSHMGEILIEGPDAQGYLDQLVTSSVGSMKIGQARYTFMCYPNGTVVDDLLIFRMSELQYLLVVNAANISKDYAWITQDNPLAQGDSPIPEVKNQSDAWALLALQGPQAERMLETLIPGVRELAPFTFRDDFSLDEMPLLISRTGYTGEDGFEIYLNAEDAPLLWRVLTERFSPDELTPCGLGARDTLRLEAKLPLYGHEISHEITPLEANLSVFVDFEKPYFIGKEALSKQQEQGIPRTLRGIKMIDPGVPREGYRIYSDNRDIGYVTSGAKSPTLNEFIALVLMVRGSGLKIGDEVTLEIHGKQKRARLVKTPFFKNTGRST